MKLKTFLLPALTLFAAAMMRAQIVDISPVPRQIEWGNKAFDRPSSFKMVGLSTADPDAVAALTSVFPEGKGVKLTIGERGDKAVEKVKSRIPDKPEGYYLQVTPKEVIIAGNDANGTYYAVQTFLALAQSPEVMSVEITDWPATPNRGVVEGFYGNAWSFDNRVSQYEFYGRNKLNTYIYGPKDDPYHRGKWRELYPADEAARMKALNDEARRHKVKFVWSIHPAGDHSWEEDDNLATVRKFEQMYDLGFRNFAVFFDDVFGAQADGKKHAAYMNYIKENFVDKHPDIESLIMCPSLYNKAWERSFQPTYLEDISVMDPFIQVMWTGNSVVDMIDVADMEWINPRIGREAFIWLNYPVNDYCINHLLMGPFTGNEAAVTSMVSGFTANPMEYAEASKVSLYSNADFLWNPESYDADASWERALRELMPDHTDAFRTFCLYNVDLGQNTHRLRRLNESPALKNLIDRYESQMNTGYSAEGAMQIAAEFGRLEAAAAELEAAASSSAMLSEIQPWIEAARLLGGRGKAAVEMYRALADGDSKKFVDSYLGYAALTDKAGALTSRDFEGSIKVAYPMVGTLYAEPFIRRSVGKMIDMYKNTHDYRLDVFPELAVEPGNYRIKFGDAFLGNPDAGAKGGNPVWQDAEDDVNPDRQIWRITYEPEVDRYSIVNAKDGRYINELGAFGVNPYDASWNTFTIERVGDSFSVRNGGNGGDAYWVVKDGHLSRTRDVNDRSLFRLVPVK